ncbi:MAG: hypothetical protein ACJAYH_000687 [Celeribacter sp.]|jgi:hypothetical protein
MPLTVSRNTPCGIERSVALCKIRPDSQRVNNMIKTLKQMQTRLNATPHLLHMGRLFNETVLLEIDGDEFYLTFDKGELATLTQGPSKKTPYRFAYKTTAAALQKFWQPCPEAGFHDIFAMAKIGQGEITGDILALVKNLRFFKEFMALGREKGALT